MIRRSLTVLLWVLSVLALPATAAAGDTNCRDETVWLRGDWGEARFTVEIADTPELRARGLMYRTALPASAGMLFVYDRPQPVAFWMENTRLSLDMIFADAAGVVQRVHHEAIPGDRTPIPGGDAIVLVLEINGGLARALGIGAGSQMQHPRIAQDAAAWPC